MRYFEDMDSKYGFSDGNAVPDGVEKYREIYVRAINVIATRLHSNFRMAVYDRAGVHNWCLVDLVKYPNQTFVTDDDYVNSNLSDEYYKINKEDIKPDDSMLQALDVAGGLELDNFIEVKVKFIKDWRNMMYAGTFQDEITEALQLLEILEIQKKESEETQ